MDTTKANEIIIKSGNSFHCRVAKYLRSKGWKIKIAAYFSDNFTGKPREIDLIADKSYLITDNFSCPQFYVSVRLYIECKYINGGTVLWFDKLDGTQSRELLYRTTPLKKDNTRTNEHHYLRHKQVAKLFADENPKGIDGEMFFKAINQSLNAHIYHRGRTTILDLDQLEISRTVHYPVIICNDMSHLYMVDMDATVDPKAIDQPFLLEVDYAYQNSKSDEIDEYFLIDVLDYKQIDSWLSGIDSDAKLVGFFHRYRTTQDSHLLAETQSLGPQRQHPR